MIPFRSIASLFLALLLTPAAVEAQVLPPVPTSLAGSYYLTNLDGTPVAPGVTAGVDVSVQNGVMTGVVWADFGNGPTPVLRETTTYELISANPLIYSWTNVAGNSGLVAWNANSQRFESIVMTGPNTGTTRAYVCR